MKTALFLSLRQLRTRWKQSLVSVLSVAVGVMILTTALSLTNGFETDMVEKILGTTPHISVKPGVSDYLPDYAQLKTQIQRDGQLQKVFPVLREQALVANPLNTSGSMIFGVPPADAAVNLKKFLKQGDWQIPGKPSVVVGSELARKLQLFVGDKVQLITAQGSSPFSVAGIFHSGLYELDVRIAVMPLDQVQALFNTGDVANELFIRLDDVFDAPKLSGVLEQQHPQLYIRTWMDTNRNLLSAMALEKKVIFLVILFIIVVAMVGIANTQIMIVMEKTADIAILRALGATRKQVGQVFLVQGILIGMIGVVLGSLLGVGASLYLTVFPFRIPGEVYDLDRLPVNMQPQDFVWVALATLAICILTSFVPARRASKADPIATLRRQV
ncbi:MAG: FtsX-like permease family protein [Candidatus Sericytochromatia bacterium]